MVIKAELMDRHSQRTRQEVQIAEDEVGIAILRDGKTFDVFGNKPIRFADLNLKSNTKFQVFILEHDNTRIFLDEIGPTLGNDKIRLSNL